KLIIHANNVVIDMSSQIVIAAKGNDPRGKGFAGGYTTCNAGPCSAGATLVGGGGSYGTTGSNAQQPSCCYCCGCGDTCTIGGAPLPYAIADDEAAAGAAGGDCSGGMAGLGGGLLAIYATGDITMQGTITANGQGGTGCAGGGSGGGVVLRASGNLTMTG